VKRLAPDDSKLVHDADRLKENGER